MEPEKTIVLAEIKVIGNKVASTLFWGRGKKSIFVGAQ